MTVTWSDVSATIRAGIREVTEEDSEVLAALRPLDYGDPVWKADEGNQLKVFYSANVGRAQIVWIGCSVVEGDDPDSATTLTINAPFAYAPNIDIARALERASFYELGGVVKMGNGLFLRHTIALPASDVTEILQMMVNVSTVADILEEELNSDDVF